MVLWGGLGLACLALQAENPSLRAPLPPELPWNGKSEALVLDADDPWATPAEASGFQTSPSYDETVAWMKKLVAQTDLLHMMSIGRSYEDRDIWMIIASEGKVFEPQALAASGKPVLLVQAGIHAGEIDGKDASLMLLRDMTVRGTKRDLLKQCHLLVIPMLSVDGHERRSVYGRINQRGPEIMGWRTNARNQNLNRDYAKLDTPELRALICAINLWHPDLYLDIHVTDGIDYQYDITFGYTGTSGYSPSIAAWLDRHYRTSLSSDLEDMGHIPGPLIFAMDKTDLSRGLADWVGSPRFSSGYGDVRHLATVLVENHSLKPFRQRVLGTYVLLEGSMRLLGRAFQSLRRATHEDCARVPDPVPLSFSWNPQTTQMDPFLGVSHRVDTSKISAGKVMRWLGKPEEMRLPIHWRNLAAVTVPRPTAYWILPAWPEVIDRLRLHGLRLEVIEETRVVSVEQFRVESFSLDPEPFEGHARVEAEIKTERAKWTLPAGSVRLAADQPLGDLAVLLLEPQSPDSFFQWGFFLESLQRSEYYEDYVMEPLAAEMMAADPELKAAFERRCAQDPQFASDPEARLDWFYARSPYYDSHYLVLPVAREVRPPR